MVTDHSLPNGQVNGHGHQRISPQWSGLWLLPSRIVCKISKIWEYFLLFVTSFTTFTAIFSFICCEINKNFELLLFSTENFVPSRFIFSYDNSLWRFSPQWSMVTEGFLPNGQPNGHGHPGITPQWSAQWLWPSRKFPQWSMVTTFQNRPYGKVCPDPYLTLNSSLQLKKSCLVVVVVVVWANPLQTLPQGPLLTICKLVQKLTRTWERTLSLTIWSFLHWIFLHWMLVVLE